MFVAEKSATTFGDLPDYLSSHLHAPIVNFIACG